MPKKKLETDTGGGVLFQVPIVVQGFDATRGVYVGPKCVPFTFLATDVIRVGEDLVREWVDACQRCLVEGDVWRLGEVGEGEGVVRVEFCRPGRSAHGLEVVTEEVGGGDFEKVQTCDDFWKEIGQVLASTEHKLELEFVVDWMGEEKVEGGKDGGRSSMAGAMERAGKVFQIPALEKRENLEEGEEVEVVVEPEMRMSAALQGVMKELTRAASPKETPPRRESRDDETATPASDGRASMPRMFNFPSRAASPVDGPPVQMGGAAMTMAARLLRRHGQRDGFRLPGERTLVRSCEWSCIDVTGRGAQTRIWWCNASLGRVGMYDPVSGVSRTLVAGLSRPTEIRVHVSRATDIWGVLVVVEQGDLYPGSGRVLGVRLTLRDLDMAMPKRRDGGEVVVLAKRLFEPRALSLFEAEAVVVHQDSKTGDEIISAVQLYEPDAPLYIKARRAATEPGKIEATAVVPWESLVLGVNIARRGRSGGVEGAGDATESAGSLELYPLSGFDPLQPPRLGAAGDLQPSRIVRRLPVICHLRPVLGFLRGRDTSGTVADETTQIVAAGDVRALLVPAQARDRAIRSVTRVLPLLYVVGRAAPTGELTCAGLLAVRLPLDPKAAVAPICLRTGRVQGIGVDDDGHVYLSTYLRTAIPQSTPAKAKSPTSPSPTFLLPRTPSASPANRTSSIAPTTLFPDHSSVAVPIYHSSGQTLAGARTLHLKDSPTSPESISSPYDQPVLLALDADPSTARETLPKSTLEHSHEIGGQRRFPKFCITIAARPREVRRRAKIRGIAKQGSGKAAAPGRSLLVLGGMLPKRVPGALATPHPVKINLTPHHEQGHDHEHHVTFPENLEQPSPDHIIPKDDDGVLLFPEPVKSHTKKDTNDDDGEEPPPVIWGDDRALENGDVIPESTKLQVVLRCRPLIEREVAANVSTVVRVMQGRFVHVNPHSQHSLPKRYDFARAFGPEAEQVDVYREAVLPLVARAVEGYDATIFAYGQTSSGKTHTLEGQVPPPGVSSEYELPTAAGIAPRAVFTVFEMLEAACKTYVVTASHLEIYNEELGDLLAPGDVVRRGTGSSRHSDDDAGAAKPLRLRIDSEGRLAVDNLTERAVMNPDDIFDILRQSQRRRQTHETMLNKASSRSHAILTLKIDATVFDDSTNRSIRRRGRLNLVDLSGSENIKRSGASGARLQEAGNINRGLLALGRVVKSIVERTPHIPYRDSKLTRVLEPALGGGSRALMILTVGPSIEDAEETISTLNYAHAAQLVINHPTTKVEEVKDVEKDDADGSDGESSNSEASEGVAGERRLVRRGSGTSHGSHRSSAASIFSPWTIEADLDSGDPQRPWEGYVPLRPSNPAVDAKRRLPVQLFAAGKDARPEPVRDEDAVSWARDWLFMGDLREEEDEEERSMEDTKRDSLPQKLQNPAKPPSAIIPPIHVEAVAAIAHLFDRCDADGDGKLDLAEARVLAADLQALILLEASRRYAEGEGAGRLRARRALVQKAAAERKRAAEMGAALRRARAAASRRGAQVPPVDPFATWNAATGFRLEHATAEEAGKALLPHPRAGAPSTTTTTTATTKKPSKKLASSDASKPTSSKPTGSPKRQSKSAEAEQVGEAGPLFDAMRPRLMRRSDEGPVLLLFDEVKAAAQKISEGFLADKTAKAGVRGGLKALQKDPRSDEVKARAGMAKSGDAAMMRLRSRAAERKREERRDDAARTLASRSMIASLRRPLDPHVVAQAHPAPGQVDHYDPDEPVSTGPSLPPPPEGGPPLMAHVISEQSAPPLPPALRSKRARHQWLSAAVPTSQSDEQTETKTDPTLWETEDVTAALRLARRLGWNGLPIRATRATREGCVIDLPGFVRWIARSASKAPAMARILVDAGYVAMIRRRERKQLERASAGLSNTSFSSTGLGRSTIASLQGISATAKRKPPTKPVHIFRTPRPEVLHAFYAIGGTIAEDRRIVDLLEEAETPALREALYREIGDLAISKFATDNGLPPLTDTNDATLRKTRSQKLAHLVSTISKPSSSTTTTTTTTKKHPFSSTPSLLPPTVPKTNELVAAADTYIETRDSQARLRLLKLRKRYRHKRNVALPRVERAEQVIRQTLSKKLGLSSSTTTTNSSQPPSHQSSVTSSASARPPKLPPSKVGFLFTASETEN